MSRAVRLLPGEGEGIAGLWGRSIVLKASGLDTATQYSLLEFTAAPAAPWGTYHTHPTTEAWYVVEGELSFRLDGQRLAAPAGSFLLAPGGVPHAVANLGSVTARYVVIFSPAGLERWFVDVARLMEAVKPGEPDPGELSALAGRYGIVPAE
ncbi:MAG TPA: cupin domain-containing protein [Burkholderiales bacterium]